MYKVLCLVILVIIIGTIIRKYIMSTYFEHFDYSDMLLTIDPIRITSRHTIDDSLRHVLFSDSRAIMYISGHIPDGARQITCPNFIDEGATLGKNNFCWQI